jgi:hypothetical protein
MPKIVREHGTMKEYRRGCRCEDCKSANNVYMAEYRERQRSAVESVAYLIDEGDMSWLSKAKCRGKDTNVFFPNRGDSTLIAKALEFCDPCPVSQECLAYALRTEQEVGIWGGKSARQRDAMRALVGR